MARPLLMFLQGGLFAKRYQIERAAFQGLTRAGRVWTIQCRSRSFVGLWGTLRPFDNPSAGSGQRLRDRRLASTSSAHAGQVLWMTVQGNVLPIHFANGYYKTCHSERSRRSHIDAWSLRMPALSLSKCRNARIKLPFADTLSMNPIQEESTDVLELL